MKRSNVLFKGLMLFSALFSLTILSGCKDSVTTPAADNVEVSMMSSDGVTDMGGLNVLVLDSIKILLKDIKLNVSASSDDSVNFKTGPFMLRLNTSTRINVISSALILEGSYNKVMFEIHKLEDADVVPDTAFSYNGGKYSVVVYGKFNAIPFIYRSAKSAKQKLAFTPAITVTSTTKSNITLTVKPYTWFWNGSDYLDPLNISNENDIDNNIKASFKAIKDDDHNGIED